MKSREHVVTNGRAAFYACMWGDLRKAALDCGWALGLHGSLNSDMDIMAMPWTEDAKTADEMVFALSRCFTGNPFASDYATNRSGKPNGRTVYTMTIWGNFYLDINVIQPPATQPDASPCARSSIQATGVEARPGAIYPCSRCGTMRTKEEGGTTFTVCDACWDSVPAETPREAAPAPTEGRRIMEPKQIYEAIEDVWKTAAVKTMALELIVSGAQSPNPDAYTYKAQHAGMNQITARLRVILDELEKLGKSGGATKESEA